MEEIKPDENLLAAGHFIGSRSLGHHNLNDCYAFGMMDGCKPECPAFVRGDCDIAIEGEESQLEMVVDEYGEDSDEVRGVLKMYPKLTPNKYSDAREEKATLS